MHHKAKQGDASGLSLELNAQQEADRIALSRYTPPAVIINDAFEIPHFRGKTEVFLVPPGGRAKELKASAEETQSANEELSSIT